MSAIVKQLACAPQAKTVSAADLLAGATKKGKSSNHLVYVGEVGCEAAAHWLDLNDKLAETERELALARDRVLDVIRPWHEDTCAKRKAHESTVVVETPTGALRMSFQHRYTKLALDREEHLRTLFGDDYGRAAGEFCEAARSSRGSASIVRAPRGRRLSALPGGRRRRGVPGAGALRGSPRIPGRRERAPCATSE